jgi:hypothetical protein
MTAKVNQSDKYINPVILEWRGHLESTWEHGKTLYDESNMVSTTRSIDINIKMLKNIRCITYYPDAITNLYKNMNAIGDIRICKPNAHAPEYDFYHLALFAVINAYLTIWNLDNNYCRNSSYAKDIDCGSSDQNILKLHCYWKCTSHAMILCYNIIRADPRLLERRNEFGKTIIDIVKQQAKDSETFARSQLCEFFRNIEGLITL